MICRHPPKHRPIVRVVPVADGSSGGMTLRASAPAALLRGEIDLSFPSRPLLPSSQGRTPMGPQGNTRSHILRGGRAGGPGFPVRLRQGFLLDRNSKWGRQTCSAKNSFTYPSTSQQHVPVTSILFSSYKPAKRSGAGKRGGVWGGGQRGRLLRPGARSAGGRPHNPVTPGAGERVLVAQPCKPPATGGPHLRTP